MSAGARLFANRPRPGRSGAVWLAFIAGLLMGASGLAAHGPLAAQSPMNPPPMADWPGAEIAPGVAFQGDGSVTLERGSGGLPVIAFWRPILFREDSDEPVAGRMDCKIAASEEPFAKTAFDAEERHEEVEELRKQQGFKDEDVLRDFSEFVQRFDVVGRRNAPHQHYVLSYILVRDGERMIDIRRNCTFAHGDGVSRIDPLPFVYRYTALRFAFEPSGGGEG